jgi:protein O-GlcNAcase/histone acetyltransferase
MKETEMTQTSGDGYKPRKALSEALKDWRGEFYKRPEYSQHQAHYPEKPKKPEKMDTEAESAEKEDSKHKRTIDELEELDLPDLLLLSDLFYLPFDYGPRAIHFMKEAHWLITNFKQLKEGSKAAKGNSDPESGDWFERAVHFHDAYRNLAILADKVINIPNRDILYDLYFYLSDMRSTLCLINSYIKWHGKHPSAIHSP